MYKCISELNLPAYILLSLSKIKTEILDTFRKTSRYGSYGMVGYLQLTVKKCIPKGEKKVLFNFSSISWNIYSQLYSWLHLLNDYLPPPPKAIL